MVEKREFSLVLKGQDRTGKSIGALITGMTEKEQKAFIAQIIHLGAAMKPFNEMTALVSEQPEEEFIAPVVEYFADMENADLSDAVKIVNGAFNDIKVTPALLNLARRGVKTGFISPIVECASELAQAMNADLSEAAKTVEDVLSNTKKALKTSPLTFAALANQMRKSKRAAKKLNRAMKQLSAA
jgi:hypothetical protein